MVFVALDDLYSKACILHGDISVGNVMCKVLFIYKDGQQIEVIRLIIIDFDLATRVDQGDQHLTSIHRTGTAPFMAIDLIDRPKHPHYLRHDFESVLYVAMWFMTPTTGRGRDLFSIWESTPDAKGLLWSSTSWAEFRPKYEICPAFVAYDKWLTALWGLFYEGRQARASYFKSQLKAAEASNSDDSEDDSKDDSSALDFDHSTLGGKVTRKKLKRALRTSGSSFRKDCKDFMLVSPSE
jgi:hypothetical protein